jgi:hypothetical protein
MLRLLIFMRDQIDNATATRQPVARRVSRREVTASHASSVQMDVTSRRRPLWSSPARFRARRMQRAEHVGVSVFLVDTPVEQEKGFSPSESATSQKLSRYTFDIVREREKRTENEACRACLQASSGPMDVTSRCNIDVTSDPVVATASSFSRHACREKTPVNPAASTKLLKLLDTVSGVCRERSAID